MRSGPSFASFILSGPLFGGPLFGGPLFGALLFSVLLLAGCALPGVYANMNEKQIAAMSQIKDAGVICVQGSGPPMTGQGTFVFASVDKGVFALVEVTKDCAVRIDNSFKPVPKPTQ